MKQKSLFWCLLTMMMVAMMALVYACSDDKSSSDSSSKGIVGTWSGESGKTTLTLIFSADETGVYIFKYRSSYSGTETDNGTFTYKMTDAENGYIIIKEYDSYSGNHTSVLTFKVSGDTLLLYEGNGTNIAWVLTKEGSSPSVSDNSVVGSWVGQEGRRSYTFSFRQDGTGVIVTKYNDSYSGIETHQESFTYKMISGNSGTMTVREYDSYSGYGYEMYMFEIKNKSLYIYDDDGDLELILSRG